jgi:hypothetical protein
MERFVLLFFFSFSFYLNNSDTLLPLPSCLSLLPTATCKCFAYPLFCSNRPTDWGESLTFSLLLQIRIGGTSRLFLKLNPRIQWMGKGMR